ncbi:peroxiredoxin [Sphingomonas sp. ID0503]|uniref:peroxiredoxin n=1 Tax=Sphingomonas sp. ID0503 TaxID=3399691 RepID=UPI003AFB7C4A
MTGLAIIVATADPARFHAALSIAAANAALGGRTRVYLHADAVALAAAPASPDDARYEAAGLPTLAQLLADALDLGVTLLACQTGLALSGVILPDHIEAGGLVSFLGDLGEDRLLAL